MRDHDHLIWSIASLFSALGRAEIDMTYSLLNTLDNTDSLLSKAYVQMTTDSAATIFAVTRQIVHHNHHPLDIIFR